MTTRTLSATTTLTHIGGPTAVIEYAGLSVITDPTFDPPGRHPIGDHVLTKLTGPAISAEELAHPDLVLLSHDQHPDNLDAAGRILLESAGRVLSTPAAAERIPGVTGMSSWETVVVGEITVTAAPARHGGPGFEEMSGPVTGFVLQAEGWPTVYVSGDNASVALVEEMAARYRIDAAILFCGAARIPELPDPLTLTAADAVTAARAMPEAVIVPVHSDGWLHFTESTGTVAAAFHAAGLRDRLLVPVAGVPVELG